MTAEAYEPLNPVQVEQKLRQLVTDLARAQIALAQARDGEVEVAPSLRWASAKISKASRSRPADSSSASSQPAGADPCTAEPSGYSDEPPF
jgi:hypothetical protein